MKTNSQRQNTEGIKGFSNRSPLKLREDSKRKELIPETNSHESCYPSDTSKTEQDLEKKIENKFLKIRGWKDWEEYDRIRGSSKGDINCRNEIIEICIELAKKEIKDKIEENLKDIEFTKHKINYDDGDYLIHFHQLEGRRLALEELKSLLDDMRSSSNEELLEGL